MARKILIRICAFGLVAGLVAACTDDRPDVRAVAPPPATPAAATAATAETAETAETEAPPPAPEPASPETVQDTVATATAATGDLDQSLQEIEESEQLISSIIDTLSRDSDNATPASPITTTGPDTAEQSGDVVWQVDNTAGTAPAEPPATIPEGQDPSLASEALAAAFALAREQRGETEARLDDPLQPDKIPVKATDGFRIALLLPGDGPGESVSRHIRGGAELALFKLGGANIDMIFLDSDNPAEAAAAALRHNVDLILGPVFAERARQVGAALGTRAVPVLSFSNDVTAAGGNVLLLGQTPEQEIETVLAQALIRQKPNAEAGRTKLAIAIISQDKIYGQRISSHAASILADAGMPPVANITLDAETLASEKALRQRIRDLTNWVPPSGEGQVRQPNFDIVILAGDPAFSLRVAPVLAWYDLDPEKVRYLGTSLWSSPAILQEPSLRGGWYAAAPEKRQSLFETLWKETGKPAANRYTIIGFDAVALATTLAGTADHNRLSTLTQNAGFAGFSGMFKLLPDGRNIRLLDVREITEDGSMVIAPA
ncbi:MAG: penicillin-binding protein activator, partial [Candidatus Puniceispirillales bacterium]